MMDESIKKLFTVSEQDLPQSIPIFPLDNVLLLPFAGSALSFSLDNQGRGARADRKWGRLSEGPDHKACTLTIIHGYQTC